MQRQDMSGVRTAQDIERKYNLGIINDLQKNYETQKQGLTKVENELNNFVIATTQNLEEIQNQVDGNITTWFSSGIPTLSNYPASAWQTASEKNNHLGDLYYDKDTGYGYRFSLENNVYSWLSIKDTDVTRALALANAAQDTADSKRRVFIVQPTPPYDVGDLWIRNQELYRCQTTKDEEQSYEANDWIVATKYTDDTVANQVGANLTILSGTVTEIRDDVDSLSTTMTNTTSLVNDQGTAIGVLQQQQSQTTQTVNEISTTVSNKVGNNEIISKINQSAEQIQINANKISLSGKTINMTSDNIAISSSNFSVDKNGRITATAGEIGGFNMNSTQFKSNINGLYNFNMFDVALIGMKIMDRIYLDSHMTNVLDIDESGSVGIIDYQRAKKIIAGELTNTKTVQGTFEINSQDSKNCISVKDSSGNIVASLGLGGVNSTYMTCENVVCGYPSSSYSNFAGVTLNGNTGNVNCVSLTQTSKEEYKKNFEKLDNALDIIKSTDIYKYNLKSQNDEDKKHIGFVIGKNYNYSEEITSDRNEEVDIYSFVSVCCKAIQEQQKIIEDLQKRIEKLENK